MIRNKSGTYNNNFGLMHPVGSHLSHNPARPYNKKGLQEHLLALKIG